MKSSFDARSITIDWPGINARENARKVVSDLEELANDMQRDKTPGSRRIAFTLDHVTRKLRPLLVMTTRGELIDSKDSICALHTLRDRKPSLGKTTTVSETRATILGQVACDDATEEAYAARNIASRFSTVPLANPDNALAFLTPLDEEGCRHIRDKLPNPLLRQLRKLAAEERTPSQPTDKPIRPKDAADYYCTTPSEPDQLPIPEGPPY